MRTLFRRIILLTALLVVLPFSCGYALTDTQSTAIQALLDDARRVSGVPGMSVAIVDHDQTFFLSSGNANREQALQADASTLYELASVSKAFTGMGILLLEERGLLSMQDSIQTYLPWLTFQHRGTPVDMSRVTLNHFLHHTSGITNQKHSAKIPEGNTPDMLQKTIEALVDVELAFRPGERYEYGTTNYDVLALVIEQVSGQKYEDYMQENVFAPLELHDTFLDADAAKATGRMAQGYRTSFFLTMPYHAPEYGGNKAAGYIMSSAQDMARWMRIQMGMISVPSLFSNAVAQSHHGDASVADTHGMRYAAGWEVNADQSLIRHAGNNPNFSTNVYLYPQEQIGICLLTNGANTNTDFVEQIKNILDGSPAQAYVMSSTQILDLFFSCGVILLCPLTVLFIVLGVRKRQAGASPRPKRKSLPILILLGGVIAFCITFPMLIGFNWSVLLVWQGYSPLAFLLILPCFVASIAWFSAVRSPRAKQSS